MGNVVSGPMSERLLKGWTEGWTEGAAGGTTYRTRFGGLVVVTGVTAVCTAVGRRARRVKV